MLLTAAALMPTVSLSKTLTIAVIDTGIDSKNPKLCKHGHKSYIDDKPLVDDVGHGTHIAGLINKHAGNLDYCIVSIKWWKKDLDAETLIANSAAAIQYANNINVDFINFSAGGNSSRKIERDAVLKALDKKITIVVSAGNENDNLDFNCNFFPACYDKRLIVVGNLQSEDPPKWVEKFSNDGTITRKLMTTISGHNRQHLSNYGHYVNRWEVGTNVLSNCLEGKMCHQTGTSQAAGIATGKLVRERLQRK